MESIKKNTTKKNIVIINYQIYLLKNLYKNIKVDR